MTEKVTKSYMVDGELHATLVKFAKDNMYLISDCVCVAFAEFLEKRGIQVVPDDQEAE